MKTILFLLVSLGVSMAAANDKLNGMKYCRTIVDSDALFGQPSGERDHCVFFLNGKMSDDANTFFGNAPTTEAYRLTTRNAVQVKKGNKWVTEYTFKKSTLENEVGAVLDVRLDSKKFCRTVIRNGSFGQPSGEAKHCVSFTQEKMIDNANTFFGNPPSREAYKVSESAIWVESEEKPSYRIDGNQLKMSNNVVLDLVL